jgi:hypothetical protein
MPPRLASTSASARKAKGREGTSIAALQSENVLRSAVSGADIARMASAIVATSDSPPLPQLSRKLADARVATREGQQGIQTSPRRGKRQKTPVASQLIAESQSLLSPESDDESTGNSLVAAVEVHVDSQLTLGTDWGSSAPANMNNCAWSQFLRRPCAHTLPPPINCSKDNCNNVIHHMCMIDWEMSENHEGPLQTVCPEHHDYFNEPPLPAIGGNGIMDDNISSSGDGLNLDEEFSGKYDDDDDNGITEYTSDQFEINERRSYYMERVPITSDNRQVVEFVYMMEADTIVRSQNTLCKPELATKLLDKYKHLILAIPANHFGEAGLNEAMCKGYYRAKKGSAAGLMDKVRKLRCLVQDVCKKLQLSKLPSGCGIFDVRDRYVMDKYTQSNGTFDRVVPDGWWLSDPSCYHVLAAIVHKDNPDIAEDPTLVSTGGTRDAQRVQVEKDREKAIVVSKLASATVQREMDESRLKIDESMLKAKAKLMEPNIELQETEGIEKQLHLMDKFKELFVNIYGQQNPENGNREYDIAVCDLLNELPFMKKRKAAASKEND